MKKTLKGFVMALALVVSAAGVTTVTTSIATAPPAAAFGLGDIKKAAKKVGGAAKSAAKRVGKDAKNAGKIVGGGVKSAAKRVGKDAKNAGKIVGRNAKDWGTSAISGASKVGHAVNNGVNKVMKPVVKSPIAKGLAKFGACWTSGLRNCGSSFNPPDANASPSAKPVNGPGGWGRPASRKPNWNGPDRKNPVTTRVNRKSPAIGFPKNSIARDRSRIGRPTGAKKIGVVGDKTFRPVGTKKPLGRDKSVWGRPVGTKKPNRVQGIRAKDLKRKQTRRPVTGRDKSVWGRPVGSKQRRNLSKLKIQPKKTKRAHKKIKSFGRGKNRMRVNTRPANKRVVFKRNSSRKGNRFEKRKRLNSNARRNGGFQRKGGRRR